VRRSQRPAYSLNFTVLPPGALSFLAAWPDNASYPGTSILNATAGGVVANTSIVVSGSDGGIDVLASNATDLLIDINGYFISTLNVGSLFGSNSINFFTEGSGGITCSLGEIILNASVIYTGSYLPADRRTLPINNNTALFSPLGTNYGGDGMTTFALPDLRPVAPNNTQYLICISGTFP
jgi:hypothetical protein